VDQPVQRRALARRPTFVEIDSPGGEDQRQELLQGLRAAQAAISPKFFYDALGSRLFEAICELPEYYLPRAEREIMQVHGEEIAAAVGPGCTLIDLGAGNCEKAERLFGLLRPAQYVAIDISVEFLREKLECVQDRHPLLDTVGVGQDFSRRLVLPPQVRRQKRLFFYPGSSIGNFTPQEAAQFVGRIWNLCGPDGKLLLGVDLVKDRAALEAAYDDALGVTAAFNLNILNNVNRVLGSDFDVRDWRHVAFFNERESRIEMHLEAKREISVGLPDGPRAFRAGERMLTENSYKLPREAPAAAFGRDGAVWRDQQGNFATALLLRP
jgi:dimethylhistidine N-methyltransferase